LQISNIYALAWTWYINIQSIIFINQKINIMKPFKIVFLFLASTLTAWGASASTPHDTIKVNPAALTKVVTSLVTYPEFAVQNKITGYVVTELKVNTDGTICIVHINSTQPELREYVLKKLDNARIQASQDLTGKQYYYRFDFQLF